jgi:hypothetical protein
MGMGKATRQVTINILSETYMDVQFLFHCLFLHLCFPFFRCMQRWFNIFTDLIDVCRMVNSCTGSVKQLMKKRTQNA